jgi:hypothetical protein
LYDEIQQLLFRALDISKYCMVARNNLTQMRGYLLSCSNNNEVKNVKEKRYQLSINKMA